MAGDNLNDLAAFMVVAQERNFTRAGKRLGVSQSALSQTVRALEAQLGLRLLTRTTRSVVPTEAGERLMASIGPRIEEIQRELVVLSELRDKPSGVIRLTATEYAAEAVLWPAIAKLVDAYPDIKVEVLIDYGLTDIVRDRFDAGVRPGETIAKDMIAVRIGPPMRMAVAGSPDYFRKRKPPRMPQELTGHSCINLRLSSHGGLYAWEFEKRGRKLNVRVDGQLVFNSSNLILHAALDGRGLAYLTEGQMEPYLADGRLVRVLEDWCEPFSGYHLYYPSRRQPTAAFALLVDALRYSPQKR
ncbi:LysR family transcriptional regulator [Paraburkholderia unamae]|uniref:DNA-binding transcriptional LysR family regulator n=1 Tax=Paraburkholderia unamae TaxID=219649 RepID=A0ABX5K5Q0_9BURK|nr:LysR family transcriptional regulator [Paraburkholderia unamae]PVX59491.1 DNA-binding transcriptional LysR family regulator [Paraburkholderia unamae]